MSSRDALVQRAVEVFRNVPDWLEDGLYFTQHDALISVGMEQDIASSEQLLQQMKRLVLGAQQCFGPPFHSQDSDQTTRRAVFLAHRVIIRPDTHKKAPLAYVMQLAGFPKQNCGPGPDYMRVSRRYNKEKKEEQKAPPRGIPPTVPPVPAQPAARVIGNTNQRQPPQSIWVNGNGEQQSMVSPLPSVEATAASKKEKSFGFSNDDDITAVDFEFYNTPPLFGYAGTMPSPPCAIVSDSSTVGSSSSSIISLKDAKHRPSNIKSSITHLTMSKDHRRTTQAAQVERQTIREIDNIWSSMFKAGTVIYKSVTMKENTLEIFKNADAVANALNGLVGIECLSGRELATAVWNGNVNQSPPRAGRKGELPPAVFKALCNSVFSLCAIEQANCQDRLNREQLKSLVGEVVNDKREKDGLDPMSDVKLYKRIERQICHLQDLTKADTRESLRVLWLTYQAQLKHYQNWEQTAVDLGFARPLLPDETPDEAGYIVWKEELLHRVLQFDEMSIALDGTDSSIGGRESRIPTAKGHADSGKAVEKSGASMTIMFGLNFANEALPPLFIFPSKAKEENYKLKVDFAATVPQVKAKYGFSSTRFHNVPFAMNTKGGMNKEMLLEFFERVVLPLYPDAADRELERLLIKIDSGPGRNNPECLLKLRARGSYLYPGLPNGTECGQECNQLFSLLKKLIYANRDRLWDARFRIEGDTASLSMADVALLVFGGKAIMVDGSEIELDNAFEQAMDTDHIAGAARKCGYCPSTRVALKSSQIRHEIIESKDGFVDDTADPYGCLLNELEKQSKDACCYLKQQGFLLADTLQRKARRVTAAQTEGRNSTVMEPNTRKRQDTIVSISTAGGWFHVTNGGAPMNCDDALIAFARKEMAKRATELEKRKQSCSQTDTAATAVSKLLKDGKDCTKWKRAELQTMIRWKQGPFPEAPNNDNVNQNKPILLDLWKSKYEALVAPDLAAWDSDDEEELARLLRGDICHFEDDVGLTRCMDTEDESIITRLQTIGKKRRSKILLKVLQSIDDEEANGIISKI